MFAIAVGLIVPKLVIDRLAEQPRPRPRLWSHDAGGESAHRPDPVPGELFGSSAPRGATEPNKLIGLLYLGALALTAGVLALGIGLLSA